MLSAILKLFKPAPPPPPQLHDFYGFRWQPNQPVPNVFQGYDLATAHGIYVGFRSTVLQLDTPVFGDGNTQVLLYALPAASAGLVSITNTVLQAAANPILETNPLFLQQLQGYLNYTNRCLNDIYLTAVGQQLLDALTQSAFPILIDPSVQGNKVQVGAGPSSYKSITTQMLTSLGNLNAGVVTALINQAMPGATLANKLTALAAAINALDLCSLFEPDNAYTHNFLANNMLYNGVAVDGTVLDAWLAGTDAGAFLNYLVTDATSVVGVRLVEYFRLAMIILLYAAAVAGHGTNSFVYFNVRRDTTDVHDLNATRPPAIGLAHELIHALHNANGTQPGAQISDFSTLLPELLCVGLGPFANAPISENAIRLQWNAIRHNADATNNMVVARRDIYDDPAQSNRTVLELRAASHTF
jgi:hypothetical protein